jgi:gas vesicle protein
MDESAKEEIMNELKELLLRKKNEQLYNLLKQMDNAIDAILLSLPDTEALATLKDRAERRQNRVKAENAATQEYITLKSRLQELENDYPTLKKL